MKELKEKEKALQCYGLWPNASQDVITSQNLFLSNGSAIKLCIVIPRWTKGQVTKSQPKKAIYPHISTFSTVFCYIASNAAKNTHWSWSLCYCVRWRLRDPPHDVRCITLKQIPSVRQGREWGYRWNPAPVGDCWSWMMVHYMFV